MVAQDPAPDTRTSEVRLLVNRGEDRASYVMPDLIGVNGDRAADLLRAEGFRVSIVAQQSAPGIPPGVVDSPAAGRRLPGASGGRDLDRGEPMNVRIAPSILSANFAELGREVLAAERGGADLIHVDVMDGHFVPNITIGPLVVRALKRVVSVPLDVHLMIEDPDRYIDAFIDAGAAMVSVHVEVLPHLHRTIAAIKARGVKAGVVLNPATPVVSIENVAGDVDFVLVMSVNPGLAARRSSRGASTRFARCARCSTPRAITMRPIEVDGGVDLDTVAQVVQAGAEMLVAGNAIFGGGQPEQATRALKAAALAAVGGRAALR